ncbi:hypothetical protein JB92DRAFT_3134660 [Gautieria morchelliformis]|nr:hypothetical protein JB92DRAFT_3134660 [Gautieria morchelliformis]
MTTAAAIHIAELMLEQAKGRHMATLEDAKPLEVARKRASEDLLDQSPEPAPKRRQPDSDDADPSSDSDDG